jgi:hypothetical protein
LLFRWRFVLNHCYAVFSPRTHFSATNLRLQITFPLYCRAVCALHPGGSQTGAVPETRITGRSVPLRYAVRGFAWIDRPTGIVRNRRCRNVLLDFVEDDRYNSVAHVFGHDARTFLVGSSLLVIFFSDPGMRLHLLVRQHQHITVVSLYPATVTGDRDGRSQYAVSAANENQATNLSSKDGIMH